MTQGNWKDYLDKQEEDEWQEEHQLALSWWGYGLLAIFGILACLCAYYWNVFDIIYTTSKQLGTSSIDRFMSFTLFFSYAIAKYVIPPLAGFGTLIFIPLMLIAFNDKHKKF